MPDRPDQPHQPGAGHPVPVEPLPPVPPVGRRFHGQRKVRLGDVDRAGRLRFDALTRYTQDVSDDDTTDAGLPADPGWVVRSTVVDQVVPAALGEQLRFVTFCSGLGRSWAERRLSVTGDRGARYEVATLWICVDVAAGRPHTLTERFVELFGEAAAGRRVSARLLNPGLEVADPGGGGRRLHRWQLRSADYDVYDHVNNAAYWAAVEHWLPPALTGAPLRARVEYGAGLVPADDVAIARLGTAETLCLWWLTPSGGDDAEGPVAASAAVGPIAPGLYR